jgi:hypothetical protein
VIGVDQELHAQAPASVHGEPEIRDDVGVFVEDGGHEHRGGAVGHHLLQPFGDLRYRPRWHPDDLDSFLGQTVELATHGVKLTVGRHEAGSLSEGQSRKKAHDEVMGARGEGDVGARIVQEAGEPGTYLIGPGEGAVPLVVHQLRRVEPRLLECRKADVRPRLVRMARQEQPLRDPEPRVMPRQGGGIELHSSVRITQRSGYAGRLRVVVRYAAPAEPPVPRRVPMVRSTIFTCR